MITDSLTRCVHAISFARKDRLSLFLNLSEEMKAQALLHLTKHIKIMLMSELKDKDLLPIFHYLDPDEITDLVQLLSPKRQKRLISQFSADLRKSVEILNQFNPESAAGLMNLDYIKVEFDATIKEVSKRFKNHEKRTGRLPAIFITENSIFKGYLPGHELGFAKPSDKVKKYLRKVPIIKHNASHDQVLKLFRAHPHNKVAVLGNKKNIIGVIYSDDIIKAIKEEETAALYDFAGVHNEESVMDSTMQKVQNRYKWLIVNLGTAFLAAFTVSIFDEVISKYVLLAVYMPIVAGMGGNAGTQTLAVMVRGLALNQIDLEHVWPNLKREISAGIINGLINGFLVASVVTIFNRDVKVAFILGIAMIFNLFVAAVFGTLVPLIVKKFGKDPATSATIFITTATDVLGFMAFLGLATFILR